MSDVMLTTKDNPFSPFTQFDEWYEFDESNHYCTLGLVARLAGNSDELSDEDYEISINKAIQEIIDLGISSNYIIVHDEK